ncbi:DnaJ-like protein [Striga asiatica]|uniref:DnaJ-like protein n=1 Tax=Striga asiatica TaxID=4170 RepID=A0A5A7P1L4_STRAF|nr:DnaJ-like protein [Striga asiatica]
MAAASFAFSAPINGRNYTAAASPCSSDLNPSVRISAVRAAPASFYEVLGIRAGATCQEIKSAYRRLARVLHPDAAAGGGGASPSADEFMRVHAAYATLSDPERREAYDRSLLRRPRAAAVSTAGGFYDFGRRRRTWETDQCW